MTYECEECGNEYDTKNGLNSHQGQAHPELTRKEVSCAVCGEEKTIPRCQYEQSDRFFCGPKCRGEWNSDNLSGEGNPSWNGGKVKLECRNCGDTFKVTPAIADDRHHCSVECYSETITSKWVGENAPNYQGGGVEKVCPICEDTFTVKKAREGIATFCGRECMAEHYKESMAGENSPVYLGGYDPYYGPNWLEQRRKARDRDQHRCQDCGKTSKEIGQEPDVHHKKRLGWFKENHDSSEWWEKGNDLANLITVCRSCHVIREPRHSLL